MFPAWQIYPIGNLVFRRELCTRALDQNLKLAHARSPSFKQAATFLKIRNQPPRILIYRNTAIPIRES